MLKNKVRILGLATALTLIASPAFAGWTADTDAQSTVSRMKSENLLQTRADGYFAITLEAITSTPQMSGQTPAPTAKAKYAVIVDGVVDRIVTWDGYSPNRVIDSYGIIVKLPANAGVKYVDSNGVTRLKPITQGSIVSVYVAPDVKVTPTYEITQLSPVTLPAEPTDTAVAQANSPVVTTQTLNADNSVSMTVDVAGIQDLPSTSVVSVYTVTDGRSTTSVGLAQGSSTVTINDLPQDQNVTVKTVIRDTLTNTETVISNPVVATVASTAPAPTPARSATTDRATITAPSISSRVVDASGALSVAIAMPAVPNFDSSKSWATLIVRDNKSGSTTAIGTDGTAQTLNVGSLGEGRDYTVSVVVRDLATGQETVISGEGISK
ncbi:MAG: hypothetical protein EB127_11695 [Alphaproteobacteria bacterium]|nr:hypothetical protein [Alphaproteobacteria bacterium]